RFFSRALRPRRAPRRNVRDVLRLDLIPDPPELVGARLPGKHVARRVLHAQPLVTQRRGRVRPGTPGPPQSEAQVVDEVVPVPRWAASAVNDLVTVVVVRDRRRRV